MTDCFDMNEGYQELDESYDAHEAVMQDKHGPANAEGKQHSRLLRIQKTVDDAEDAEHMQDQDVTGMTLSDMVKLLSEIDNLESLDKLVEVGQVVATEHRQELQHFVRHSLFCQCD